MPATATISGFADRDHVDCARECLSMTMSRSQRTAGAGLLAFAIVVSVLTIAQIRPPAPVPSGAPETAFSAERAFRHVQAIARAPRPVGSDAHRAVGEYLQVELRALGLAPESQERVAMSPHGTAAWVRNVIARMPGTRPGSAAVLLATHYDTVPHTPGAGDAAAGVAALLETARALKAGAPLASDVIFLFSDAEEIDYLGARTVVREHPWLADVGVMLNFEARGHTGPAYMFETSPRNGLLIEALAEAAPYPTASSLMFEIYRRMPNDTDFTVFKQAGVPGLNFAFIGGPTHYHMPLDTPENLDLGSLQHHGSYALALARHLGDQDLRQPPEDDRVYFDLFGRVLVHHPQAWVWPLAILAGLGYLGVVVLAWRRGRLAWTGLVAGVLAPVPAIALTVGAVWLVWQGIVAVHPAYRSQSFVYEAVWYWLGFLALTCAVVSAWHGYVLEPVLGRLFGIPPERRMTSLALGALLWWLALLVAVAGLAPGGSYLFLWPLLASLAWLALACAGPPQPAVAATLASILAPGAGLALAAVPALVLLLPVIHGLHVARPIQEIPVAMVIMVLVLGALTPQLDFVTRGARWLMPALGLATAVIVLATATITAGQDAERPRGHGVFYLLDAERGQAHWVGLTEPDEWTAQLLAPGQVQATSFADALPRTAEPLPASPASALDLPAPTLDVVEDGAGQGGQPGPPGQDVRRLRLRVRSPRQARLIYVHVRPEAAVQAMALAGQSTVRPSIKVWNPPDDGFDLVVEIGADAGPVEVTLVDVTPGLPAVPGLTLEPRPQRWMLARSDVNDSTLVSETFRVPAPP
jgi:Peptidase family M28